jgi:hypothetical protein
MPSSWNVRLAQSSTLLYRLTCSLDLTLSRGKPIRGRSEQKKVGVSLFDAEKDSIPDIVDTKLATRAAVVVRFSEEEKQRQQS